MAGFLSTQIADPVVSNKAKVLISLEIMILLLCSLCGVIHSGSQMLATISIDDVDAKVTAATAEVEDAGVAVPDRGMIEGGGGAPLALLLSLVIIVSAVMSVRLAVKGMRDFAQNGKAEQLTTLMLCNGVGACGVIIGIVICAASGMWFAHAKDVTLLYADCNIAVGLGNSSTSAVSANSTNATVDNATVDACLQALTEASDTFGLLSMVYFITLVFMIPLVVLCTAAAWKVDRVSNTTKMLARTSVEAIRHTSQRVRNSVDSRGTRGSITYGSSGSSTNGDAPVANTYGGSEATDDGPPKAV